MEKIKYTTVEGHEIEVGGEYETRGKTKAKVLGFTPDGFIIGWEYIDEEVTGGEGSYDECMWKNGGIEHAFHTQHDLMRPWKEKKEKEEPKKTYKLSEMWKVWHFPICGDLNFIPVRSDDFRNKEEAEHFASHWSEKRDGIVLAITRADATEFYEGEGLSDD